MAAARLSCSPSPSFRRPSTQVLLGNLKGGGRCASAGEFVLAQRHVLVGPRDSSPLHGGNHSATLSTVPRRHAAQPGCFCLLGLVYLIAFWSLATQILGLAGRRHSSSGPLLTAAHADGISRYWMPPTLTDQRERRIPSRALHRQRRWPRCWSSAFCPRWSCPCSARVPSRCRLSAASSCRTSGMRSSSKPASSRSSSRRGPPANVHACPPIPRASSSGCSSGCSSG